MAFHKLAVASTLTLGLMAGAHADGSLPGSGVEVQALQSPIAEETFQTLVINEALTTLGYDVKPIKEVDYSAGYISIANGDATYLAVNWYPLHNTMYQNAGGDDVFYRKGHYISGAAQGYLIDKKTADKYGIDNIGDLKDPKIAKLFDTDGDGKADLTGCQAGWGCEGVIEHQLDAFKLRDSITHKQGQYAAIISDTIARYNEGESVLYYTWTPYWVSGKLVPGRDVVWLEVPHSANPNGTDTALSNGKNYGFEINSERVVANRKFAEQNPAAAKLFEIVKLPINAVSAENMLISAGEDSQKQIGQHAKNWIKANQSVFDGWINEAKKAAK
ncbi:glycine betaine/L-proline ABC transporter substrate-binding protein ProX [Alkalimarinus sediminis]|uniref:Glycine betaine/L-proline ABC transporter substrate-binding protein ProX n=1 Tax=Alkalimarinus sediminis TaxID=1632866 RepID=A0A9E8HHU3_9ALTE|nr:glycine betaine/L-proline ABC transporter substrate-binding protein ProX [Alkalimarinus sediminis]UZW74953.1 glycine betaine/L-proline ABC transporter substrate-binding protein ProX [Alkalimarinus sediminis]